MSATLIARGLGANRGVAEGTLSLANHPADANGAFVMVAPDLNHEDTPVLARAVAVIATHGGLTCDAAIAARALGKPCVVSVREGLERLTEGLRVRVDGSTGEIFALDP